MPEKALSLDQLRKRRSIRKETEAKIAKMMLDLAKKKKEAPKVEEKVEEIKEESVVPPVEPVEQRPVAETSTIAKEAKPAKKEKVVPVEKI